MREGGTERGWGKKGRVGGGERKGQVCSTRIERQEHAAHFKQSVGCVSPTCSPPSSCVSLFDTRGRILTRHATMGSLDARSCLSVCRALSLARSLRCQQKTVKQSKALRKSSYYGISHPDSTGLLFLHALCASKRVGMQERDRERKQERGERASFPQNMSSDEMVLLVLHLHT